MQNAAEADGTEMRRPPVASTGVDPVMTTTQAYQYTNGELKPPIPRTVLQFLKGEWRVLAWIFGAIFAPFGAYLALSYIPATKAELEIVRSDNAAAVALVRSDITGELKATKAELNGAISTTRAELRGEISTANAKLDEILHAVRQPQQQAQQPLQVQTVQAGAAAPLSSQKRPRPSAAAKPEQTGPLSWLAR